MAETRIDLINPNDSWNAKPYPIQQKLKKGAQFFVQDLINKGDLVPSPPICYYSSPALFVDKQKEITLPDDTKTAAARFVVDFRVVNRKTKMDGRTIPNVRDTLRSIPSHWKYYWMMDLEHGFFQLKLAEDCRPYTTIVFDPTLGFDNHMFTRHYKDTNPHHQPSNNEYRQS